MCLHYVYMCVCMHTVYICIFLCVYCVVYLYIFCWSIRAKNACVREAMSVHTRVNVCVCLSVCVCVLMIYFCVCACVFVHSVCIGCMTACVCVSCCGRLCIHTLYLYLFKFVSIFVHIIYTETGYLIRSHGTPNGARRFPVGQCYDKILPLWRYSKIS